MTPSSTIIAYELSAHDLGAYYYAGAPAATFCPGCGSVIDHDYTPSEVPLFRYEWEIDHAHEDEPLAEMTEDIGYTYDGHCLVSERFKRTCDLSGIQHLNFALVNGRLGVYDLRPKSILRFDAERRQTQFIGYCNDCDDYAEVIGANPAFLTGVVAPIADGIFRTDLLFGSNRGKHFLIIVGVRAKERLEEHELKGMLFRPVAP